MDKVVLQKCSYGVYIVSSRKAGRLNGQIANTVFQVTSNPPTVAVCINKENLTHEFIRESRVFTVSILAEDAPMPFIGKFGFKSGRDIEKFEGVQYKLGMTKAPVVTENTTGYLECEVINSMDVETHTIFVGKVVDAQATGTGKPMTYEYYHQIKGGKSPKTAPTYAGDEPVEAKKQAKEATGMAKYTCTICGYVYDPEQGDSTAGIKPGTAFEDLPDTWVCPICGAPKDQFEKTA